ncbi:MAG: hypothetical protein J6N21_07835 [Butyrivibrio sp.]|nr:hypothetical protein [Butyrivibrio sp.]MBP3196901.1 hypothetical protein [Butyrivibrio sp.]
MIEGFLKNITIEYLDETDIGQNILKAMAGIQKAQETVTAYMTDDSPEEQKAMRAGTVIAFAIVSKIASGKPIKEFTKEDWMDIASKTADCAVLIDGQRYSEWVFSVYVKYVEISVKVLEMRGISKEKRDAISKIANDVRTLSKRLEKGQIEEAAYTEQCLWLLLEAMIKLITSYSVILVGDELADFNQSVAILAFEYARYTLYRQEQAILDEYLKHQHEVDAELEDKFANYKQLFEKRNAEFSNLMKDAFDSNIAVRLKSSVAIARNVGVKETEILDSIGHIDDYFS